MPGRYGVGWDGRVAVTEADGSKVTVGGKAYELIGYDENGSKVYQDIEVLKEQSEQAEAESKQADESELASQVEGTEPEGGPKAEVNDERKAIEKTEDGDIITTTKGIGLQFFAKRPQDYPTVILDRAEYAHVMSEIATNLTKEQAKMRTFSRAIGGYIYFVENNGFGEYRIYRKIKILED